MVLFYAIVMTRLFDACESCNTMRTRIAVALFAMDNPWRRHGDGSLSRIVREFSRQIWHEPISFTVMGGILVLDYSMFGAVCEGEKFQTECPTY